MFLLNESFQMAEKLRIKTTSSVTFTFLQVNAYTSSVGVGPGAISPVETGYSAEAPC